MGGRNTPEWVADLGRNTHINKALCYYNEKRRHSSIDYLAPDDFIKRELALTTA